MNNGAKTKFYEIEDMTDSKLKFLSNNKSDYRYQPNENTYEIIRMTFFQSESGFHQNY